jgi:hypothetical protein
MEAEMDAFQEKVNDTQEETKVQVGSLPSWIDGNQEDMTVMLDACLEKMEANPGEQKSAAVHDEVSKEKATMDTFRALKKWHGDQDLAVGCCGKPKIWTQCKGGSQKKLAAAHRRMTRRAGVAWCKGHDRANVALRTQRG